MSEIRQWLDGLGLGQFAEAFESEQVLPEDIADLTEDDLKDLGVPLGPRKRILKAASQAADEPPAANLTTEAERRQITVMFCDLAGSTALSERLDPEDLRTLMQAYQQACGVVIERYDGHVAQYLGDGLMTYFGWPTAHEDDAERAIRTALEIVHAVKAVAAPEPLQVRVGIATSPVVVGETGAGDASVPKLAVGETPNIAARLQALAGADEVVLGETSRRLAGQAFAYEELGEQSLKGILEPVRAYRALAEAAAGSRFEAYRGGSLTPLVGREEETTFVSQRWQRAKTGKGQVVLLSGEAGIGKSRILEASRELVSDDGGRTLHFQCSPHHRNTAFYAFTQYLSGALATDDKLAELDALA
ncbi:MAG: adenylate/guanylate cyclase domain-containing protein, partial [Alphaproteobacteria bacterium]|nr:adenylate/guanylate cyclase domain-containing protein [Alphaproteobacteria bacterium]